MSIAVGRPEDQGALAHVVEGQRREDDEEPRPADRRASEVPHVGVERLRARDREHDRAERDEGDPRVRGEELDPVARRQRLDDRRVCDDPAEPGDRQDREPDRHHGTEHPPDPVRPVTLDREQRDDHRDRDREDQRFEARLDDLEALDRREHRDRRGDHPVAVEERDPEHPQPDQDQLRPAPAQRRRLHERDQRHDPALAVVVGAHDEGDELDRDDQGDRPEDERDHSVDVSLGRLHRVVVGREHGLQRVQRARADVAEDDAERPEGERRHPELPAAFPDRSPPRSLGLRAGLVRGGVGLISRGVLAGHRDCEP